MTYDIYFHNDFDGRASAAVMLAFLRSRGDDIARYVAVTYGDRNEKGWNRGSVLKGENEIIVVDFQYHPKAAWWFDHHATGIKNKRWEKQFRPDKQHRLDPHYRSCAHLVYDSLKRDFGWKPPRHLAELAKWLDVIDGANYPSAKSAVEMRDPAFLMNAFIEVLPHTAREDARVVRLLAEKPISAIVRSSGIAGAIRKLKQKRAESLRFYKHEVKLFGRITFIDLTRDPLHGFLRFTPFYLYPKAVYGVRMRRKGAWWYLGVGVNPWRRSENGHNLGALMRGYGGGGHGNVGAAEFRSKKDALAALEEVKKILNRRH